MRLILLCAGALLLSVSCKQRLNERSKGAVVVRELTAKLQESRTRGKPGDLLLTNGRVSLVIEKTLPEKRRSFMGQPIDLWLESPSFDRVEWLGLSLQIDTLPPKPIVYQKTASTGSSIRSTGSLEATAEVTTEYSLKPNEEVLSIKSSIKNISAQPLSLSMCQTGYVGNFQVWAPGEGFMSRPIKTNADWLGYEARGSFYAVGVASGAATVQPTAVVIDEATFHNGFLLCTDKRQLAPQETTSQEWLFALSSRDLADATATLLTRRGERLVTLSGQSKQEGDQWVEILREKKPFTRAMLYKSRFSAMLPASEYEAFVSTKSDATTEKKSFSLKKNLVVDLPSISSGLLEVQVTESNQKSPSRIIIYPEKASKITPLFHSVEHLDGSGNSLYSLDGSATVALSPGWYRVLATRGMEYNLPEARVEVKAGQTSKLSLTLTREVDTSGAVASDLHLHSIKSRDSNLTLESRVISLIAEGLEVAVSTEHENIVDYAPTVKSLGAENFLKTIVGEEITTAEPNLGHFNVFPIAPLADGSFPEPVYSFRTTPEAIFTQARELDPGPEIVQINHPRMEPKIGYFSIMSFDPTTGKAAPGFSLNFDTIEVFNGLELPHLDKVAKNLADWYALLNMGSRKVATGSSDSHVLALQEVGYPRTYVFLNDAAPLAEDEFIRQLKAGKALVTNGPFLRASLQGAGPGETASLKKGVPVKLDIEVRAASWVDVSLVDVVVDGVLQSTHRISLVDGVAKLSAPVVLEKDGWIVVFARGEKPLRDVLLLDNVLPFAFQNPIFVKF